MSKRWYLLAPVKAAISFACGGDAVDWDPCYRCKVLVQKMLARVGIAAVIISTVIGSAGVGWAQSAGRKVIRLEAIKVEGRIQKPQAFYILQRSNLNFEGLELKQSFIPKIIKSIEKQPF